MDCSLVGVEFKNEGAGVTGEVLGESEFFALIANLSPAGEVSFVSLAAVFGLESSHAGVVISRADLNCAVSISL